MSPDPVLHLLVGPDGAGKTSFAERVLLPTTHLPFVNADIIAAQRWPEQAAERSYDAAQLAAEERSRLIADRVSFVAETVFSHPSKLALLVEAGRAGYLIAVHVPTASWRPTGTASRSCRPTGRRGRRQNCASSRTKANVLAEHGQHGRLVPTTQDHRIACLPVLLLGGAGQSYGRQ